MKKFVLYPILLVLLVATVYSCKKSEELEDPSYKCECGSFTWQGTTYPLNDASRIEFIDTTSLSRKYYATAELREGNQFLQPNSLNMMMEFEDISQLVFSTLLDTFNLSVQEINYGDPLTVVREFQAEDGIIVINPSFPGTDEKVSFNLVMRQVVNGQFVGLPLGLSGSMTMP